MADLFWSVATSYAVLSIIGTALVAALIVGHFPLIGRIPVVGSYVVASRLAAYLLLALLAFLIGFRVADERAEVKQLKADLAFKQMELDNEKATAATSARLRAKAEADVATANQKVTEYEERLAQQPASDGCDIGDGDHGSLLNIAR